jgi:hypothetical protein
MTLPRNAKVAWKKASTTTPTPKRSAAPRSDKESEPEPTAKAKADCISNIYQIYQKCSNISCFDHKCPMFFQQVPRDMQGQPKKAAASKAKDPARRRKK